MRESTRDQSWMGMVAPRTSPFTESQSRLYSECLIRGCAKGSCGISLRSRRRGQTRTELLLPFIHLILLPPGLIYYISCCQLSEQTGVEQEGRAGDRPGAGRG